MAAPFAGEPDDTREAIMQATYGVLREHGYAGLSISRIADRAGLSKSSLYNHFEGKDDLLLDFVDFTIREFVDAMEPIAEEDPLLALQAFLSFGFPEPDSDRTIGALPSGEPHGSFVELRSQAVHDTTFRDRFARVDTLMKDRLVDAVERGQQQGTFRNVDPEGVAETLVTLTMGALMRRATNDQVELDVVRAEIEEWIERRLFEPGVDWTEAV